MMVLVHVSRLFLCAIGCGLSLYAYHVETTKETNPSYTAMCDLSETVSCSTVFTSRYGKGFGIIGLIVGDDHPLNMPNSVFGLMFFIVQMLGVCSHRRILNILLWMSAVGIVMCFYLAYILAFILHDFCVVCVSTYALSFGLHLLNYMQKKSIINSIAKKKR